MVSSLTEKHELKKGSLSFHATKEEPLIYYTATSGHRGMINMKEEGKHFIIIPVD